jgi:hypothetical protein
MRDDTIGDSHRIAAIGFEVIALASTSKGEPVALGMICFAWDPQRTQEKHRTIYSSPIRRGGCSVIRDAPHLEHCMALPQC